MNYLRIEELIETLNRIVTEVDKASSSEYTKFIISASPLKATCAQMKTNLRNFSGEINRLENYIKNFDQSILDKEISILPISRRPMNALKNEGFNTIRKLMFIRKMHLKQIPNMGKQSANEVIEALRTLNLELQD